MTFWIPNPVPGTPDLYRLEISEKAAKTGVAYWMEIRE